MHLISLHSAIEVFFKNNLTSNLTNIVLRRQLGQILGLNLPRGRRSALPPVAVGALRARVEEEP